MTRLRPSRSSGDILTPVGMSPPPQQLSALSEQSMTAVTSWVLRTPASTRPSSHTAGPSSPLSSCLLDFRMRRGCWRLEEVKLLCRQRARCSFIMECDERKALRTLSASEGFIFCWRSCARVASLWLGINHTRASPTYRRAEIAHPRKGESLSVTQPTARRTGTSRGGERNDRLTMPLTDPRGRRLAEEEK